ncbi:hypothetical protein PFFVO_01122, partial [Plasmodium falciparum Vietnam Oak-Knoll (FVO)]
MEERKRKKEQERKRKKKENLKENKRNVCLSIIFSININHKEKKNEHLFYLESEVNNFNIMLGKCYSFNEIYDKLKLFKGKTNMKSSINDSIIFDLNYMNRNIDYIKSRSSFYTIRNNNDNINNINNININSINNNNDKEQLKKELEYLFYDNSNFYDIYYNEMKQTERLKIMLCNKKLKKERKNEIKKDKKKMCINNKNDYNNKSYDNDNEKKRTRKKKYINIKNKKNKKDIVNKNMFYRNNLIYNTNEEFNESNRHSIYYSNGKNINSSNILFLLTYKTKVLYEDKYNIFLNENNNIFMPNIKEENEWFLNMNNIYFMIKSREVKKSYKIIFKELLINITIDNIKELYKLYNNFRYNIYFASFYKNYFSFFKNIYIHPFKNKNQSLLKKSSEKLEIQNIYLRNMHKFKMLKNHIIYNKLKQMSKNKIYRINKNKYIYQQEIEGNKKFSFQMNKNKYIHKNNNCDIYYSDNENDNLDIISSNQNDRHYKYVNRNKMKKRRNVQNNKIGKDKKNKSKDTEREKLIYSIKNTEKLENIESQKCTNKDNKILYTSFSNKNEIFNVQDKYTYKERKHIKDISKKGNEKMKGNLYNLIKGKTIYEHNWEENQYNYNNINTLYYARRRFLISNMNIYKKMVDSYIKIQPLINLENTNRKYFEIIYNIKEKYTEIELYKENLYNLYNQIFLIINNINNEKNIICHGLIFLKLLNCFYPYNNNYIRNLLYYLFVFSKYNKFAYYLCNIKKYFHYNYFLTFTKILHTNDIWNDIHINQKTNNNSKAFYKTSQEYYSLQKDTKHVPIILNTNQRINENISIHKEITENFKKEGMFKEN